MTSAAAPASRSDSLLYFASIALAVPTLISLIHRHFPAEIAPDVAQFVSSYRAVANGVAAVIDAPLRSLGVQPGSPMIDLQILSFAGMGMMTRALETPREKADAWHAIVWGLTAFVLGYLLVGILVMGAILATFIANPIKAFHSDRWIETTPLLEGPQGRLRRERTYRLERDLARIMAITLAIVGGYFAVNFFLLPRG